MGTARAKAFSGSELGVCEETGCKKASVAGIESVRQRITGLEVRDRQVTDIWVLLTKVKCLGLGLSS